MSASAERLGDRVDLSPPRAGELRMTPPTAGDVRLAAAALGWPAVEVDGQAIAGEAAWRAALDRADADARLALWEALGDLHEDGQP
jgi:hypothetical protein